MRNNKTTKRGWDDTMKLTTTIPMSDEDRLELEEIKALKELGWEE